MRFYDNENLYYENIWKLNKLQLACWLWTSNKILIKDLIVIIPNKQSNYLQRLVGISATGNHLSPLKSKHSTLLIALGAWPPTTNNTCFV